MPYPFTLPTTSFLSFQSCLESTTHPSLPLAATTHRGVVRAALKRHKRLSPQAQTSNLNVLLKALEDYVPYLLAIDASLCGKPVGDEDIDMVLQKEFEVEWRSSIGVSLPGREPPRTKGKGLDFELISTLSTLANLHSLQARSQLILLFGTMTPTSEQRTSIITTATKHLLSANSIHAYLTNRCGEPGLSSVTPETSASVQGGLASLALAEATLLAVLKDDLWPAVVAQERNQDDKEWMIKPPEIPKVRTHLFARLCQAAAERADTAESMLQASATARSGRVNDHLLKYVQDLKRTSRAKACRFFGLDADLGGETGKGIAWLNGAETELGFAKPQAEGSKFQGLAKFKKDWTEKREDKKVSKGGEWGSDAGRFEEGRIIEMLKGKWNKMNDTVSTMKMSRRTDLAHGCRSIPK